MNRGGGVKTNKNNMSLLPSSQMIIIISLVGAKGIGWPPIFIDQGSKVTTVFPY